MTDKTIKPGVLVTGAAGGIGRAVAELFASQGHPVTLTDRDEAGLERIGRRLRDRGCKVDMIARDLLDPEAPGALVARTVESWGGIGILVNNAAHHGTRQSVLASGPEEWREVFEVNVIAAAALARHAALDMARRKEGAIVNVGSIQQALPVPSYAAYAASKGAVAGMTRALAVELGVLGIRVNSVSPGVIGTENFHRELEALHDGAPVASCPSLLGRAGTPEDAARVIAFLAGPHSSHVTGADYPVDGGRSISRRSDPFLAEITHPVSGT
ncbi:SDR family NAD(P)-dependent oxidoreductase [Paracoccus alkanivorans]|uniref:SDR family NAD(P)-dependent oxidoreductase n=1 Tax=Paracoccus alkanivorans TaxID=2116655 RepID=A0A3M0MFQ9_9RHOB|nr:SDR family oxidoreductase [Paracoccus alkanivorans]RMC36225.1 SDR family NAD(P)-dependent oxidoreductase [Paracoccus alkanivorans]